MKSLAFLLSTAFAEPELDLSAKYRVASALNEALATKLELDESVKRHQEAVKKYEALLADELKKIGKPECGLDRQQSVICPPKKDDVKK